MEVIKVVKINEYMYKNIKNLVEFYENVGLFERNKGKQINVTKVHVGLNTHQKLRELLFKNNYRKGKYRNYNKNSIETMVSWEMLYGSPVMSEEIPDDEIWLEEGWLVDNE